MKFSFVFAEFNSHPSAQISYTDRLRLAALVKQVVHGKYTAEKDENAGFFNFVGSDRVYVRATLFGT